MTVAKLKNLLIFFQYTQKTILMIKQILSYLFLFILSLSIAKKGKPSSERPNIIVIMADDLGYRDLGVYGCKDIRTPNIDKLAHNGGRFTSAYVTGCMCGPSRAGFITGRNQSSFGYYKNPPKPLDPSQGFSEGTLTFASLLQQQGYTTGGVGKWHMGTAPHQHPNAVGYDDWFGFLGGGLTYYPLDHYGDLYQKKKRPWGTRDLHHTLPIIHNQKPIQWEGYVTHVLTDAGTDFINENKEKPFYLFMSYNAPHLELEAPQETIAKYPEDKMTEVPGVTPHSRSIYAAMVEELDQGVGKLMQTLEKNGLAENTIIWFLSDHGGMKKTSDNRPLKGAKGSFDEGGLRVPLIVHWPKKIKKGTVYDGIVSSLDIGATAVALAGGEIKKEELHGEDLTSYITHQQNTSPRHSLCWRKNLANNSGVIRDGKYKLFIDTKKLYDLENDIHEDDDIASKHPELVNKLVQQWKEWSKVTVDYQLFKYNSTPNRKSTYQFGSYDWLKGNVNYKAP